MNTMRREITREKKFIVYLAQVAEAGRRKTFTKGELDDIALQNGGIKPPLHWEEVKAPSYEGEDY